MDKSSNPLKYSGLIFYTLLFTFPLLLTLSLADLQSLRESVSNPYFLHILSFSFSQAFLSAFAALLVGIPGAYILTYRSFKFKKALKALFTVPFILPPILVVLGFVVFYGNNGYLNRFLMSLFGLEKAPLKILYSFKAVLLAHIFYNFPIVITLVSNSILKIDHSCEEAALCEGSSSFQLFSKVVLPRIIPSAASAAVLVFLYCFTSFSIILVLGGDPALTTLEVEIYRQGKTAGNINMAASLSILSTAAVSFILMINSFLESRSSVFETDYTRIRLSRPSLWERAYLIFSALFVLLPLLSIVLKSASVSAWKEALKTASCAVNSFLTACVSAVLSVLLSLSTGYLIYKSRGRKKGLLSTYCTLPMVTSSVISGLSYYVLSRYMKIVPSFILLVFCHAVLSMPFCLKILLSTWKDIPPDILESAANAGASERNIFFKIQLPLLSPSLRSALLFSFAVSMGELNATMILAPPSFRTIPLQIYRLVSSYRYDAACALGTLLCIICFLSFSLVPEKSYI